MLFATCDNSAMGSVGLTVGKCLTMTKPRLEAASAQESWLEYGRYVGEKFHEVGLLLRLRDDPLNKYHDEAITSTSRSTIRWSTSVRQDAEARQADPQLLRPGNPTSLHYEYERIYAAVTKRAAAPDIRKPVTATEGLEGLNLSPQSCPRMCIWMKRVSY